MKKLFLLPFLLSALIFFIQKCSTLPGSGPGQVKKLEIEGLREIKISFTGDIIMHDAVKLSAEHHNVLGSDRKTSLNNLGFDYLFEKVSPYLRSSNMAVGNMEFPVSPPFKAAGMVFNCIPEIIPSMKSSGFTAMTIANNHILDGGIKGIVDTINYLNTYSMDIIGVNSSEQLTRSGLIKEIGGIKIGLVSYAGIMNYPFPRDPKGFYINNVANRAYVKKDIAAIRAKCDYLVMIVHSGNEYEIDPLGTDVIMIKENIEDGVDLVIRHHPHVLQPAEKVIAKDGRETFIFYSLGNFISNQGASKVNPKDGVIVHTRDSMIPTLILKQEDKKLSARFEVLPVTTINRIEAKREIQTVPIKDEINSLREKLKNSDGKMKGKIDMELKSMVTKNEHIKKIIFRYQDIKEIRILEPAEITGK